MASDEESFSAQIELTNGRPRRANGAKIPDHTLGCRRTLLVLDEVQGYAFQAMMLIAGLLRRFDAAGQPDRWMATAADQQRRFSCDFCMQAEAATARCWSAVAGRPPQ